MADRSRTLLQATSTIFVLMTVLPLLIFTWTLYRLGELSHESAQIALGLSLLISLTGFAILRSIMSRLSELSRGIGRAAGDQGLSLRPQAAVSVADVTPGIGSIDEFDEMTATMSALWQREAVTHVGHRVLISLVRVGDPMRGTLQELTPSGLVLNHDGEEIRIPYPHIAGIEPAPPQ